MNRERIQKKLMKELRDWCADEKNTVVRVRECQDSIRAALRSPAKGPSRTVVYLASISHRMLSPGQLQVVEGAPMGWALILRSLAYHGLASALHGPTEGESAPMLALASGVGADRLAEVVFEGTLRRPLEHVPRDWDLSHFPPFAFSAFVSWRGVSGPDLPNIGPDNPYAPLMPGSVAPSDLGGLVARLADIHLEQALQGVTTDDGYPDFGGGFELFPVELMWLRRIWAERGVAWPEVDHPLLNTPLYHPPKDLDFTQWRPGAEDAVYSEVRAAALKAGLLSDKAIQALPA